MPLPLENASTLGVVPDRAEGISVRRMMGGYLLFCLLGILALVGGPTMRRGNGLSWDRAVFSGVNAITLTGFQLNIKNTTDYLPFGQAMLLLLTVGGSLSILAAGGMAVARIVRLPYSDRRIIAAAGVCEGIALLVGGIFMVAPEGSRTAGTWITGPLQSAAAFGNSGITLVRPYSILDWRVHLILLPLAVLGGLGLPVLLELIDRIAGKKKLSCHARTVLGMTAGLYIVGLLLFVGLHWASVAGRSGPDWPQWREVFAAGSIASLNTRTAGISTDFSRLFPVVTMQWVAILFMMIGAGPGGTGGGLKTTTVAALFRGTHNALSGRPVRRVFGIAASWTGAYLLLAGVSFVILLITDPQIPGDRLLFIIISAVSNVGLSVDPISITGPGLFVLSGVMLLGRLAPLAVLWWMVRTTSDANLAVG